MALTLPSSARAVAVFNPAAPDAGFLQPLFSASGGDNRSFVQLFTTPDIVEGFHPVTWPGRDFESLLEEPVVDAGGPTLWSFQFPDGERIADYWPQFRAAMRERIAEPGLARRPLLLFDIVDTLDLGDVKRETFLRAFRAYADLGEETAARWRDRAILEPALARAWLSHEPILRAGDRLGPRRETIRARLVDNMVEVHGEQVIDVERQLTMQRAYEALARELPELFPGTGVVVTAHRPRPRTSVSVARVARLQIVLVGEIGQMVGSDRPWLPKDAEVLLAEHFHPDPVSRPHPMITLIVGAHHDWREMVEVGNRIKNHPAAIIALSTTAAPLLRDLRFQDESRLPSINFFAPFATSARLGRDPVKTIEPLIGLFLERLAADSEGDFEFGHVVPSHHNMLIREPLWAGQSETEVACRLAARALKAGAVPSGYALLFSQGAVSNLQLDDWTGDFARIFSMAHSQTHLEAKRTALMLLVQRQSQLGSPDREDRWRAIQDIFEMRGWRIKDAEGWSFAVETVDGNRRFQVTIAENASEMPSENPAAFTPGLTQAHLLVIHTAPKREQLLIGNRGQFFHAAVEDIALMEPGTDWVWPIVQRQLFEKGGMPSQAALRMCAALVAEAIRLGNIAKTQLKPDWKLIAQLLRGPDCERFVMFESRTLSRTGAMLVVQARHDDDDVRGRVVLHIGIEEKGPVVTILAG